MLATEHSSHWVTANNTLVQLPTLRRRPKQVSTPTIVCFYSRHMMREREEARCVCLLIAHSSTVHASCVLCRPPNWQPPTLSSFSTHLGIHLSLCFVVSFKTQNIFNILSNFLHIPSNDKSFQATCIFAIFLVLMKRISSPLQ